MYGREAAADVLLRLRTNYDSIQGERVEVSRRRTAGSGGLFMRGADKFTLDAM